MIINLISQNDKKVMFPETGFENFEAFLASQLIPLNKPLGVGPI